MRAKRPPRRRGNKALNLPSVPDAEGNSLSVGFHVVVDGVHQGIVRYIGPCPLGQGEWLGLELLQPIGDCDGSVRSRRMFSCRRNHGLFLRPRDVLIVKGHTRGVPHSPGSTPTWDRQRHQFVATSPPTLCSVLEYSPVPPESRPDAAVVIPHPREDRTAEIADLRLEVETLKAQLQQEMRCGKCEDGESTRARMALEIDALKTTAAATTKYNVELEGRMMTAREKLAALSWERVRQHEQLKKLQAKVASQMWQKAVSLSKLTMSNEALESELRRSQEQAEATGALEKEKADLLAALEMERAKAERMSKKKQGDSADVTALKSQLSASMYEQKKLQNRIKEFEKKLKEEHQRQEAEKAEFERQLREKDEEQRMSDAKVDDTAIEAEIEVPLEEQANDMQDYDDLMDLLDGSGAPGTHKEDTLFLEEFFVAPEPQNGETAALEDELNRTRIKLAETEVALNAAKAQMADGLLALGSDNDDAADNIEEVQKLREENAALLKRLEATEEDAAATEAEDGEDVDRLSGQLAAARASSTEKSTRIAELKGEVAELRKEEQETEARLAQEKKRNEENYHTYIQMRRSRDKLRQQLIDLGQAVPKGDQEEPTGVTISHVETQMNNDGVYLLKCSLGAQTDEQGPESGRTITWSRAGYTWTTETAYELEFEVFSKGFVSNSSEGTVKVDLTDAKFKLTSEAKQFMFELKKNGKKGGYIRMKLQESALFS